MSEPGGQRAEFKWLDCLFFPWGLSWLAGDNRVSARWEEVVIFSQGKPDFETIGTGQSPMPYIRNFAWSYTLTLANGQSKSFYGSGSIPKKAPEPIPGITKSLDFLQLAALLELRVARAQLPEAINSFDAGQAVSFGRLAVDRGGITTRHQSLPWSEVKGARLFAINTVVVKKSGMPPLWLFPAVKVPNYSLFIELVRAILTRSAATPPG